jgi:hypothetical protein
VTQGVVLRRRNYHVVVGPANGHIRDPQRLSIGSSINGAGEAFAEGAGLHGGGVQRIFLGIHAVASQIVVIGKHACEIGNRYAGGCGNGSVSD